MKDSVKKTGIAMLAAAAAGAALALIVRDQLHRHQRDLFNPRALRRLAALGYMAREQPSVDHITLLRDFVAWEPRRLLRNRAQTILARMERAAEGEGASDPEEGSTSRLGVSAGGDGV